MKALYHSCQGESHIRIDKVCQDYSYCEVSPSMSIAVVCDGHGGQRYFRSNVGARMATEVTVSCIKAFVKEVDKKLFKDKDFTPKAAVTTEASDLRTVTKETATDKAIRQLLSSIIYEWRTRVEDHAKATPLSDEEKTILGNLNLEKLEGEGEIEKTYGCTLICYVCTPTYWFAFQVGDGKCIAFDTEGKWSEPIPWDDRCFLNRTTSICDSSAIDEFRYCYCGNGTHPTAIFLGSDGIDDSFGETENMVNFYIQILKAITSDGVEKTEETLRETLPQLSKIGSKDDMSVACIYDDRILPSIVKPLTAWQRDDVNNRIDFQNNQIGKIRSEIERLESDGLNNQRNLINFQYAQESLKKAFEEKRVLIEKINRFSRELYGDGYSPYWDEIGIDDSPEHGICDANSPESGEDDSSSDL